MKRTPLKRHSSFKRGKSSPSGTGRATAPQKRKNGYHSITRDRADHFMSLYIRFRDNWTCQRCSKRFEVGAANLHNSHFWTRGREATRFDPLNCDALCAYCHDFLGKNPELHREFKLQRIGEQAYMLLRVRAESRCKKDRKMMSIACKQLYEKEKARYEAEL